MQGTVLWLTPLILLTGVALLVVSTSSRVAQLHAELRDARQSAAGGPSDPYLTPLHTRVSLFRKALISLYVSIGVLACASLMGGWAATHPDSYSLPTSMLTAGGIACLLFAAIQLIRESLLSVAQTSTPSCKNMESTE